VAAVLPVCPRGTVR